MHPYGLPRDQRAWENFRKWGRRRKHTSLRRGTKIIRRRARRIASMLLRKEEYDFVRWIS